MNTDPLIRLIEDIVREFMAHPDKVKVSAIPMTRSVAVSIDVAPSEVGRVIGEKGSHFRALEKICMAYGRKFGRSIELMPMVEPEDAASERYGKFKGREDWRREEITMLILRTAKAVFRKAEDVEISGREMPSFVSVFSITVSKTEDSDMVNSMQLAMKALFNAVGRANGRVVMVEIIADKSAGSRQPATAAGRFSKEVRR